MLKKVVCAIIAVLLLSIAFMGTALAATDRSQLLLLGDEDKWVTELQEALYEKGYLKVKPTGYFGRNTQNAVMEFQKDNKLAVDGKAGPLTRKALLADAYQEMNGRGIDDPVESEAIRPGDRGDNVSALQQKLKDLEYYDYSKITGYFGPITTDAVKKFQRSNNLAVDGIVGVKTKAALETADKKDTESGYYIMCRGDRNEEVRQVQDRLRELGYFDSSSTGYFGSITLASVRAFQKQNGLVVDGLVGKNTRTLLYSDDAKKADADSSVDDDRVNGATQEKSQLEKFIEIAESKMGCKYVYSTEGPDTFDCSGLIYYSLRNAGVKISRMSSANYSKVSTWADVKSKDDLIRGDLIFFKSDSSNSIGHVAIYIGDNKILHAIPSEGKVTTSTLTGYWNRNYVSAKRVF